MSRIKNSLPARLQAFLANDKTRVLLGMSKQRVLLVNAFIVFLVANSLFDIALDEQHWPFAQYDMYSDVERSYSVSKLVLFGVEQEPPYHEIPLRGSYIQPFDQARLNAAFRRINSKEKREHLLNEALLDSLTRYEQLRLAGRHNGPPLQGVRLYKMRWRLDNQAENVDRPDRWELVAEVEQP